MKNFKLFSRSEKDPDTLTGRSMILPIVFYLVCGVLLIVFGNRALKITAYVLSGVLILWGGWSIIGYIRSKPLIRITESKLAVGLALLVGGVLLAFNPDYLSNSLHFIWGLALLFGCFLKIQYAFDEKSVKVDKWWIMLILAAVSLVIGILSLLNTLFQGAEESRGLFVGIALVVEAVLDLVVFFLLKRALGRLNDVTIPIPETPAAVEGPKETPALPGEGAAEPAENYPED